jgi:hypothetical protein
MEVVMSTIQNAAGNFQTIRAPEGSKRVSRVTSAMIVALALGAFMMGFAFSYYAALPAALAGTAYLGLLASIN